MSPKFLSFSSVSLLSSISPGPIVPRSLIVFHVEKTDSPFILHLKLLALSHFDLILIPMITEP